MKQIPFNLSEDGTCRTIKAQYYKNGFANFIRGGGTEQRALRLFQIWRSQQNGWVYDPEGLSPCLGVGHHSGVEPKIIEYDKVYDNADGR